MPEIDWEQFWSVMCGFEQAFRILFIILVLFVSLTIFSAVYVDRDSGTYLIILYNFALFGGGLIIVGSILRKCSSGASSRHR